MIDYGNEDVQERVMALMDGRGVDGVVDTVSGESATAIPTDGWDIVRNIQVIDDIYRAAGMQVWGAHPAPELERLP